MSGRGSRLLEALLVACLVLSAGQAVMLRAAVRAEADPRQNRSWVHWDSFRYLDIAQGGYAAPPGDPAASNTGWFPGYALLIRLGARWSHARPALVGRVITLAFTFALLVAIGLALPDGLRRSRRVLSLFVAGFFPGWYYGHAVFPLSIVVFFSLAALLLGARGRFLAAGTCGALGAFTYPTGFLVAGPLALEILLDRRLGTRERAWGLLKGPALAVLGLVAVFAVHSVSVGHWDAYLRYQQQFGQGLFNPLAVLVGHARPLLTTRIAPASFVSLQTMLATALLLVSAVVLVWRRHAMRMLDMALLAQGTLVWLFVNGAGPNVSIYRQAAALVCLVPLLARLASPVLAILLVALVALGVVMAELFFRDVLV